MRRGYETTRNGQGSFDSHQLNYLESKKEEASGVYDFFRKGTLALALASGITGFSYFVGGCGNDLDTVEKNGLERSTDSLESPALERNSLYVIPRDSVKQE